MSGHDLYRLLDDALLVIVILGSLFICRRW